MSVPRACIACALLQPVHGSRHGAVVPGAVPRQHNHPPQPEQQQFESPARADRVHCSVAGGCAGSGVANAGSSNSDTRAPYQRERQDQVPAGGGGRRLRDDGRQQYNLHMFSFGPLYQDLLEYAKGLPGTEVPSTFNTIYPGALLPGDPATTDGASDNSSGYVLGTPGAFTFNGAIGLTNDIPYLDTIFDISEGCSTSRPAPCTAGTTRSRSFSTHPRLSKSGTRSSSRVPASAMTTQRPIRHGR